MSPYFSAHDEWLIMNLCMYVGYHDANNVSNFGGDPVTQLNFKNIKKVIKRFTATVFHTAAVCALSRSNSRTNCDRVTAMERYARKTFQIMRIAGYH